MREKGTLLNFLNDGAISVADYRKLLRVGKIAAGRERTQLITREDLRAWGVLNESNGAV